MRHFVKNATTLLALFTIGGAGLLTAGCGGGNDTSRLDRTITISTATPPTVTGTTQVGNALYVSGEVRAILKAQSSSDAEDETARDLARKYTLNSTVYVTRATRTYLFFAPSDRDITIVANQLRSESTVSSAQLVPAPTTTTANQ